MAVRPLPTYGLLADKFFISHTRDADLDAQACFSSIVSMIESELDSAKRSIDLAVTSFSNSTIFDALLRAARRGCRVRLALADNADNRGSGLNMERLRATGSEVYWIQEAAVRTGTPLLRFCIIDDEQVITGSYNWAQPTGQSDEYILQVRGEAALVADYKAAFTQQVENRQSDAAGSGLDTKQLMRRLEIIQNLLLLDDHDLLAAQLPRLAAAQHIPAVTTLLDQLQKQNWTAAQETVANVLARGLAVVPYTDPALAMLRLELRTLEVQVVAFNQEQAELERLIGEFDRREQTEIGDLLEEYLSVRQRYWQQCASQRNADTEEYKAYEQAKEDYEQYRQSRKEQAAIPEPIHLDPEQQRDLKRLFRAACMYCHPDRVIEADQARAAEQFIQVRQAYQRGDLAALRRLHEQMQRGQPFADPASVLTEADQLRRQVSRLQLEAERLLQAVRKLHEHETYRTLTRISDWERHFAEARRRLTADIQRLRTQLKEQVS